jgi:exosortase
MGLLKHRKVVLQAGAIAAVLLALLWAYWPTLEGLAETWSSDPNYSQGFLVPVLALAILWHRCRRVRTRDQRSDDSGQRSGEATPSFLGLVLLLSAAALRWAGAYFYVTPLDHLSLLVTLAGACLLFGGWVWLGRAWPAIAFLLFMIPIPRSLGGSALIGGLQQMATTASTFALQTLGVTAQREGNVILLKEAQLGIVEACSGLRMLMVFCAFATATAILLPYGWKRRAILIGSAVPLAVTGNVIRITAAGLASENLSSEAGHFVFHDLAGWLMLPLAFGFLGLELFLLSRLFRPAGAEHSVAHLGRLIASSRQVTTAA